MRQPLRARSRLVAIATAAALAASVAAAPASASATSVERRSISNVILSGTGVGVAHFGQSYKTTLSAVTSALGKPVGDSGWRTPDSGGFATDKEGLYRMVAFPNHLQLYFRGSRRHGVFRSWAMGQYPAPTTVWKIRLTRGISVGSTVGQLRRAYPNVKFTYGEGNGIHFTIGATLFGQTTASGAYGSVPNPPNSARIDGLNSKSDPVGQCC